MSGGEPSHSRSRLSTFKIGAATTGEGLKLGPSNPDLGSTPFALSSSYPPIRSVGSPLSLSSRPGRTLEGISGFGSLPFSDPPRSDATTVYQDRMDDGGELQTTGTALPPTLGNKPSRSPEPSHSTSATRSMSHHVGHLPSSVGSSSTSDTSIDALAETAMAQLDELEASLKSRVVVCIQKLKGNVASQVEALRQGADHNKALESRLDAVMTTCNNIKKAFANSLD